jgi:hypothetical protein
METAIRRRIATPSRALAGWLWAALGDFALA